MTESLLLQETGDGYFLLEDESGRILLEIQPEEAEPVASSGGWYDEELASVMILRGDDEIIALVAPVL